MHHLYLIGYMGSGKSTVGKMLAERLKRTCVDIDKVVEDRSGHTISSLFSYYGEDVFREIEHHALRSVALKDDLAVIATGGGLPCFHNNIDLMKKSGRVIYLRVSESVLKHRLIEERHHRPLIAHMPLGKIDHYIKEHLARRASIYEMADVVVDGDNPAALVCDAIVARLDYST